MEMRPQKPETLHAIELLGRMCREPLHEVAARTSPAAAEFTALPKELQLTAMRWRYEVPMYPQPPDWLLEALKDS